jgi:hypothetical protein
MACKGQHIAWKGQKWLPAAANPDSFRLHLGKLTLTSTRAVSSTTTTAWRTLQHSCQLCPEGMPSHHVWMPKYQVHHFWRILGTINDDEDGTNEDRLRHLWIMTSLTNWEKKQSTRSSSIIFSWHMWINQEDSPTHYWTHWEARYKAHRVQQLRDCLHEKNSRMHKSVYWGFMDRAIAYMTINRRKVWS